ncbi:hypothetical protein JCM4814A_18430 [Streptomyces phaeofaciens JCM 4814]|uniref:Uncharacterized protein n=1 Tax=Streptomyces phaeofaciens TaxID=68254 RepID=A0A918LW00_9ACTN|nr:hypothetical protein [Streptomyces phaeofaciens]GGT57796.1 hypothetical protein GCM10010226_38930 [Streptomyces phaeofaciens]
MPTQHAVRISGPDGAHPEFAAIRLIAQLPTGWTATLLNCSAGTAALTLTVPDGLPSAAVDTALATALATAPLRGWTRD